MRAPIKVSASVSDELAFVDLSFETQEMIKRLASSSFFGSDSDYERGFEQGFEQGFRKGVISTRPFPKINER